MRTKELTVPTDIIVEVALKLSENEIESRVTGVSEDDDVIIEVEYSKDDRPVIFEIEELIDDCYEDEDEENDDED